jgi:hypothetical protein
MMIILQQILKKYDMRMWIGVIWRDRALLNKVMAARSEVLTAASMKMTLFWAAVESSP